MKKLTKLMSILTPVVTASAIIPVAASCVSKNNGGDEKAPTIKTLNMSKTTSLNELMKETTPFCVLNENVYSDADVVITVPAGTTTVLQYNKGSFDGSKITWEMQGEEPVWTPISTTQTITIKHTTPIRFCAYNTTTPGQFSTTGSQFRMQFENGGVRLGGSLLSLVASKQAGTPAKWTASLELKTPSVFQELFLNSYAIGGVSTCMLPFTKLTKSCYESMFEHCDNMTSTPALPATTLAESCYKNMFREVTDLQTAPHLPAKKLAKECYYGMFDKCEHLKSMSLSYVGNFVDDENHYFFNWVHNGNTSTGMNETAGTIYYNGLDTELSPNAIPKNYKIVQDSEFIAAKTTDIQFKDDSTLSGTQTSILTSTNTNKNKVRFYNTDTIADVKSATPPVVRKTAGEAPLSYMDKDAKKIADTTKVSELTDKNIYLRYAQDDFIVDYKVCNIISRTTGEEKVSVTLSSKCCATYCSLQVKEGNNGKWRSWAKGETILLKSGEGLQIRGNIANTGTANNEHTEIGILGAAELDGTIMSLITTDAEYKPATALRPFAFYKLFYGSQFVKVSDDFLCIPYDKSKGEAPTLLDPKQNCYNRTFSYCQEMEEGPAIIPLKPDVSEDSNDLNFACGFMFERTKALKVAPQFHVNNIGYQQCINMFIESNVVDASKIKIGTSTNKGKLNSGGCIAMFQGCSKLEIPPDLTDLDSNETHSTVCKGMFWKCSSLKVNTTASGGKLFFNAFSSNNASQMEIMMPKNDSTGTTPTPGSIWYYHLS